MSSIIPQKRAATRGRILFLTYRMARGYGVDVVVQNISKRLVEEGFQITIACVETDGFYRGIPTYTVVPELEPLEILVRSFSPTHVVAHTSPWFELLPKLGPHLGNFKKIAWEHGDPTPELFSDHRQAELRAVIEHKRRHVYGSLDGIVAISEFIRHDIACPQARVILNGCDHVRDLGAKKSFPQRPLKIGTLMRLGPGEAQYKGSALYVELCESLRESKTQIDASVMGRGTSAQAEIFKEAGLTVHLNANDNEKQAYLRDLDVFVACSQWEGFNLPLVEAQAMGTLSVAFDAGAHPEVCPFIFGSKQEFSEFIKKLVVDRGLLARHSETSYRFARERFKWDKAAAQAVQLFSGASAPVTAGSIDWAVKFQIKWIGFKAGIKHQGLGLFSYRLAIRLARRTLNLFSRS